MKEVRKYSLMMLSLEQLVLYFLFLPTEIKFYFSKGCGNSAAEQQEGVAGAREQ